MRPDGPAAVAERVVLDLLEDSGVNSVFLQVLIAFIEEAEIQQIVVDQAAYQELSGKVACTASFAAVCAKSRQAPP